MRQPLRQRYVPPRNYDLLETHPQMFTKSQLHVPRRLKTVQAESKLRQMRRVYEPLNPEEMAELRAEREAAQKRENELKNRKNRWTSNGFGMNSAPLRQKRVVIKTNRKEWSSQKPNQEPVQIMTYDPVRPLSYRSVPSRTDTQTPQPWNGGPGTSARSSPPRRSALRGIQNAEPPHDVYLKFLVEVTAEIIMKRIFDDHRMQVFLTRYIDERGSHLRKEKLLPMINLMLKDVGISETSALASHPAADFEENRVKPDCECTPRETEQNLAHFQNGDFKDQSLTSIDVENILKDNFDYLLKRGYKEAEVKVDSGKSEKPGTQSTKSSSRSKSSKSSEKEEKSISEKSKSSTKSKSQKSGTSTPYSDFESDRSEISSGQRSPRKFDLQLAQKSRQKVTLDEDLSLAETAKSDGTIPSEPDFRSGRSGVEIEEIAGDEDEIVENLQIPKTPENLNEEIAASPHSENEFEPDLPDVSDASAIPPDPGAKIEIELDRKVDETSVLERKIDDKIEIEGKIEEKVDNAANIVENVETVLPDSPLPERQPPLVTDVANESPKSTNSSSKSAHQTPKVPEIVENNESPKQPGFQENPSNRPSDLRPGTAPEQRQNLSLPNGSDSDEETSSESSLNSEEIAEMLTQTSTYLQLLQEGYMRDDTPLDVITEEDEEQDVV